MQKRMITGITCSILLWTVAAQAVINFESDTVGAKPNGWASADDAGVLFFDTVGAQLQVGGFGIQGLGSKSLGVFSDGDGSKLKLNFTATMASLSLWFGNDDVNFTVAGDKAWLQLYNGATLVTTTSVILNRNDVMDQSIAAAGTFDNALFWYGNALGAPYTGPTTGLIEIVDNIEYTMAVVPEPSTYLAGALMLLPFGAQAVRRWKTHKTEA
jgi:hypothetical protein